MSGTQTGSGEARGQTIYFRRAKRAAWRSRSAADAAIRGEETESARKAHARAAGVACAACGERDPGERSRGRARCFARGGEKRGSRAVSVSQRLRCRVSVTESPERRTRSKLLNEFRHQPASGRCGVSPLEWGARDFRSRRGKAFSREDISGVASPQAGCLHRTMPRDRALYFPHIDAPSGAWFVQSLLYWDRVLTIVPGRHDGDVPLSDFTQRVIAEGLVDSLHPGQLIYQVPNFGQPFLDRLDRHRLPSRRRTPIHGPEKFEWIHMEKLGDVANGLRDRKFVRNADGPWVELPKWLANQFMTYLAVSLGRLREANATPITNDVGCWSCLVGPMNSRTAKPDNDMSLPRIELLEVLLPLPETIPSVAEIASFKREHQGKLSKLRKRTEAEAAVIATAPNAEARSALRTAARDRLASEIEAVADAMKSKWRVVIQSGIAALPVGWAMGQALIKDPVSIASCMATVPAALAIHQAAKKAREHTKLMDSPLAYAAAFQRSFGPPPANKA